MNSDSARDTRRSLLLAIGMLLLLGGLLTIIFDQARDSRRRRTIDAVTVTVNQASLRVQAQMAATGYATLDNEVLRQIAFAGQETPVNPREPLLVRQTVAGLSAFPLNKGRHFALTVNNLAREECEALAAHYVERQPVEINGQPVPRPYSSGACRAWDNLLRLEFGRVNVANANAAAQPGATP